jgi:hypothetical protein
MKGAKQLQALDDALEARDVSLMVFDSFMGVLAPKKNGG